MTRPVAPLKRRFAALSYESLLIASVTFVAGLIAGILNTLVKEFLPIASPVQPLMLALILLYAWWLYFKLNWLREGQTLPMRVWKIGLCDHSGRLPEIKLLMRRFLWSCVLLVFIPLLVYAVLRHNGIAPKHACVAALCWWILPWGFAWFNPRRQFLYDYLSGTELCDLR